MSWYHQNTCRMESRVLKGFFALKNTQLVRLWKSSVIAREKIILGGKCSCNGGNHRLNTLEYLIYGGNPLGHFAAISVYVLYFVFVCQWYRPFHKTLPRSSLQMHWISVRFYETGCSIKTVSLSLSLSLSLLFLAGLLMIRRSRENI